MKTQRNIVIALIIGLLVGFFLGRLRGEPDGAASPAELLTLVNERLDRPLTIVRDKDSMNTVYLTSTGKPLQELRNLHLSAGIDAWRGTLLVKRFGDATSNYYDGTELIIGEFVLKGDPDLIERIRDLGTTPARAGE